jgi:DNA-binding MarR family transcriptional regulator
MNPDASRLTPLIVADVFELAGRFRDRGEAIARRVGQSQARWQVMSVASAGPRTVPQIARRLGVSRQAVQRIADALVADGSAAFERNPDHATSPLLSLTPPGRAALAAITRAARADHRDIAARLGEHDLAAIHQGLRRLLDATRPSQGD